MKFPRHSFRGPYGHSTKHDQDRPPSHASRSTLTIRDTRQTLWTRSPGRHDRQSKRTAVGPNESGPRACDRTLSGNAQRWRQRLGRNGRRKPDSWHRQGSRHIFARPPERQARCPPFDKHLVHNGSRRAWQFMPGPAERSTAGLPGRANGGVVEFVDRRGRGACDDRRMVKVIPATGSHFRYVPESDRAPSRRDSTEVTNSRLQENPHEKGSCRHQSRCQSHYMSTKLKTILNKRRLQAAVIDHVLLRSPPVPRSLN